MATHDALKRAIADDEEQSESSSLKRLKVHGDEPGSSRASCPICGELFQNPRLLSCLHTICGTCCQDLFTIAAADGKPLVCPLCSEKIDANNIGQLTFNHTVIPFQNVVPTVVCGLCSEMAIQRCNQCSFNLCSTHQTSHQESRSTKSHELKDLKVVELPCRVHPTELCEKYCETCKMAVCSKCTRRATHKSHDIVVISDSIVNVLSHYLDRFRALSQSIQEKAEAIVDMTRRIHQSKLALQTEINTAFDNIATSATESPTRSHDLTIRRNAISAQVDTTLASHIKTLELQRDGLEPVFERCKAGTTQVAAMISVLNTAPLCFVQMHDIYSLVDTCISELQARERSMILNPLVQNTLEVFVQANASTIVDVNKIGMIFGTDGQPPPAAFKKGRAYDVDVSASGCSLVACPGNPGLQVISPGGFFVETIGRVRASLIAACPSGKVWLIAHSLLICLDEDGQQIVSVETRGFRRVDILALPDGQIADLTHIINPNTFINYDGLCCTIYSPTGSVVSQSKWSNKNNHVAACYVPPTAGRPPKILVSSLDRSLFLLSMPPAFRRSPASPILINVLITSITAAVNTSDTTLIFACCSDKQIKIFSLINDHCVEQDDLTAMFAHIHNPKHIRVVVSNQGKQAKAVVLASGRMADQFMVHSVPIPW